MTYSVTFPEPGPPVFSFSHLHPEERCHPLRAGALPCVQKAMKAKPVLDPLRSRACN